MKKKASQPRKKAAASALIPAAAAPSAGINTRLSSLRSIIREARQQVLRAADVVQVRTCWLVGRHIVEFEQGGGSRAVYGKDLLTRVSAQLTAEFGAGFDRSNLYKMSQFYRLFPNLDALRLNLSWTHYRLLLRVDDQAARTWYMNEAADQNWSTRALDRQNGTLYYERLFASRDRKPVRAEAKGKTRAAMIRDDERKARIHER